MVKKDSIFQNNLKGYSWVLIISHDQREIWNCTSWAGSSLEANHEISQLQSWPFSPVLWSRRSLQVQVVAVSANFEPWAVPAFVLTLGWLLGYLILSCWRFDFQFSFHKWLPITLSTSNARAPNSQLPVVHSSAILVSYNEMFPTLIHQKCLKKKKQSSPTLLLHVCEISEPDLLPQCLKLKLNSTHLATKPSIQAKQHHYVRLDPWLPSSLYSKYHLNFTSWNLAVFCPRALRGQWSPRSSEMEMRQTVNPLCLDNKKVQSFQY